MTNLPITHMTLYKHGVGYFERRGRLEGEAVTLSFRTEAMNDVLKSLTAIDWGDGKVLGVEYATPQSREEQLAGCSVSLADDRSLQDLLISLRGRQVQLLLDQGEALNGILVGLDDPRERQPLASGLVSILLESTNQVQATTLERVQGVEILDPRGAGDLRFFLRASLSQENYRQVTVRLSPGQHDLSVSYVAPAPTWRVSYRLVVDEPEAELKAEAKKEGKRKALLLGWGIFDNRLEEDLEGISLALVAGMPISFIYDLYTPFTPQRPEIAEEGRVAPGPVSFEAPVRAARGVARVMALESAAKAAPGMAEAMAARAISPQALADTVSLAARGEEMGELFQYQIGTPVTVGRGQSAMVPIVSATIKGRKDLLYNGAKLPQHPVATLRLDNQTGLTLERGPVTVLEGGQYVGEALLPLTPASGEILVPYAVELGVKVREESGSRREIHGLEIQGHYLLIEEWDVRWRRYQANNSLPRSLAILVEQPRIASYELFETPEPLETTAEHQRFLIDIPAAGEGMLTVQERRLLRRREELQKLSGTVLQGYVKQGLLRRQDQAMVEALLGLWEQIAKIEGRLAQIEQERQKVYQAQEQIQGNMKALSSTGKEGSLRASYVDRLGASEEELQALAREEQGLKQELERLKGEVDQKVKASSGPGGTRRANG